MKPGSRMSGGITLLLVVTLAWSTGPGLTANSAPSASLAPSMWVTPLVLDFGPVGLGDTTGQLTATITNIGSATLSGFAGGGVNAPFSGAQNCAGGVPPGASCQYFFTFSPTETGVFTTTSNSGTNAGAFSIELRGEGVGPRLHVSANALDFGYMPISSSSPQQSVDIHNTGLSTLSGFAGGGVNAPFSGAQNCAGGVAPGGSCQYFFTFSPTETGLFTATSSSGSNAGPFSIDMEGRGTRFFGPGLQRVTPRGLDFGPVGVGSSGATLAVDITNQSPFTSITDWAGGGVNPPFGGSQNCAGGLLPGGTCQFFYTFAPTETGVFSTTSNVANSAGSFTIQLNGEGLGAGLSVSPLVLDFGHTDYGQTQVVTVKNTGMATLSGFAGGGVNPPFSASQNCAGGVPPGGTCQFNYEFNPDDYDRYTTFSNVSTNAGSFSIQLIGGMEPPDLAQAFLPSRIAPGDATTLQVVIGNPNAGATLFGVTFLNEFPEGLSVADPLLFSKSPECGTSSFQPAVGDTSILLWDGTVLSGDDCVINVSVTAPEIGVYTNALLVGATLSANSDTISATLHVGTKLYLPAVVR